MRRAALVLLVIACAGCATWSRLTGDPLARADALAARGDYASALALYDDVVRSEPDGTSADRARAARTTVASLLAARAQIVRLERAIEGSESELDRMRRDLASRASEVARLARELQARDAELSRARQELTSRQGELGRLTAEAARLRNALEDLKRLEIRMERPR